MKIYIDRYLCEPMSSSMCGVAMSFNPFITLRCTLKVRNRENGITL